MRVELRCLWVLGLGLAVSGAAPAGRAGQPDPAAARAKIDPWVLATGAVGPTEFLVVLSEQADLSPAAALRTKEQKGRFVFAALSGVARRTQGPLLELLARRGVEHRPYWVANMVWVRGHAGLAEELAARADVARIHANPEVPLQGPVEQGEAEPAMPDPANGPQEWGVLRVRAPEVWRAGVAGEGVVIGGQDTGYDWDHPALIGRYRGWNGASADHNYHWHDAIHAGGGVCGPDSPEPCDDHNHGTHTMGTMAGTGGIGVAPGARWIGCRNMNQGNGTPATYSECFQWFIAPTNLAGTNPDPSKAPHIINNSWSCPPSEGCTDPNVLRAVVEATRAAGILVVVSAGNSGSACSTVSDPAAIYQASFSVGATSSGPTDPIASFSSRGPVTVDGSNRLKPDISAPGVSVRSSIRNGGYGLMSGTSMAGPHVAGVAGLLLSAYPWLRGQVDWTEAILEASAVPRTTAQVCGTPGKPGVNNVYGHGRVDAWSAHQLARQIESAAVAAAAAAQKK